MLYKQVHIYWSSGDHVKWSPDRWDSPKKLGKATLVKVFVNKVNNYLGNNTVFGDNFICYFLKYILTH